MDETPVILIVTLTVRQSAEDKFDQFENQAAGLMRRHGGRLERVIRLSEAHLEGMFREVHIVNFRDRGALNAYMRDPDLAALGGLRSQAILSTEVVYGEGRPVYG